MPGELKHHFPRALSQSRVEGRVEGMCAYLRVCEIWSGGHIMLRVAEMWEKVILFTSSKLRGVQSHRSVLRASQTYPWKTDWGPSALLVFV